MPKRAGGQVLIASSIAWAAKFYQGKDLNLFIMPGEGNYKNFVIYFRGTSCITADIPVIRNSGVHSGQISANISKF